MTKAYPIQTRSTEGDGCVLTKPRGLALATRIVCGPTCGLPHQDQNFKRLYPRHTFLLNERLFIIFLFLFPYIHVIELTFYIIFTLKIYVDK